MRLIKKKFYNRGRKKVNIDTPRNQEIASQDLSKIMDKLLMQRAQIYLGKTRIALSLEVPSIDEDIIDEFIKAVRRHKDFQNLSDDVLAQMAEEIYNQRIEEYKASFNPNTTQIRYNELDELLNYPGLKEKIYEYIQENAKDVDGLATITIELIE